MCSIPKDMLDSEKMQESNNVITSENSLPSIAYQPFEICHLSWSLNVFDPPSGFNTDLINSQSGFNLKWICCGCILRIQSPTDVSIPQLKHARF
jgi:hypothetical protein